MALCFTASAPTPTAFPFETRTGTLERLLAAPLERQTLLMDDVVAAFLFGVVLSAIPIFVSLTLLGDSPASLPVLLATVVV
ncbi:MAG: hypothetical protein ACLFV2_06950 [Desulfurivibrionaceae bacterium]